MSQRGLRIALKLRTYRGFGQDWSGILGARDGRPLWFKYCEGILRLMCRRSNSEFCQASLISRVGIAYRVRPHPGQGVIHQLNFVMDFTPLRSSALAGCMSFRSATRLQIGRLQSAGVII